MTALRVSTGQAGAEALKAYLQGQLTSDITVMSKWPDANTRKPRRIVTVIPVGRRQRLDVSQDQAILARTNLSSTQAQITVRVGAYIQPVQLDVWDYTYAGRDDLIDQLDDALTQGWAVTMPAQVATDDPVRDGITIPLVTAPYVGNVDIWLDEPEIDDSPDAVQRSEYRATYFGEMRGDFMRVRTVPRMASLTAKIQSSTYAPGTAPAGTLYDTTTLSVNPTPPPAVNITHGTST